MNKVLCIMGPTASGKTDLAIEIARTTPADLISVDSALIYKGMDIGTAKPDAPTLQAYPHQLVDIIEPEQSYSAADFCRDAKQAIEQAFREQRLPILVGGTMMYFNALQNGLSNLPQADAKLRQQLQTEIANLGLAALYAELEQVDPVVAKKIKPTDSQRIQRALEVFRITGKPLSAQQQRQAPTEFDFINVAILPERALLHERIAKRFQLMLKQGLIDEVEMLKQRGTLDLSMPSMRAVGYRQVWEYLDGAYDKATMIEKGIAATRQLAKRQITWCRRWESLQMLTSYDEALLVIKNHLTACN